MGKCDLVQVCLSVCETGRMGIGIIELEGTSFLFPFLGLEYDPSVCMSVCVCVGVWPPMSIDVSIVQETAHFCSHLSLLLAEQSLAVMIPCVVVQSITPPPKPPPPSSPHCNMNVGIKTVPPKQRTIKNKSRISRTSINAVPCCAGNPFTASPRTPNLCVTPSNAARCRHPNPIS